MMAAVICNQQKQPFPPTGPQQSGSSQGLDSGLQSDGKKFHYYGDYINKLISVNPRDMWHEWERRGTCIGYW
jgi:hypothetical protein